MKTIRTADLDIAYLEQGPADGYPVVLLHGFPDDAHAYDAVATRLNKAGYRTLAPFLRGYGPTRILDQDGPKAGQQAAIGIDLMAFLDALRIPRAALVGYDWGGRAACITAALAPERVRSLITCHGYTIQDTLNPYIPSLPDLEAGFWYQWYCCTERGRVGFQINRREICRKLWRDWSPTWDFTDEQYEETAKSFDNPDFVEVVIHSYRHRNGEAPGVPLYQAVEERLAAQPKITVPALVLHGADDRVDPPWLSEGQEGLFTGGYQRRVLPGIGHFVPAEAPDLVADAALTLLNTTAP